MLKLMVGALSLTFVIAPTVMAQLESGQGQQLYEQHCVLCHQESGAGAPPVFPALSANDQLVDSARIVRRINAGTGRMPPFPALTPEEMSSLVHYIRNAWTNDFGDVTAEEVTAALEGLGDAGPVSSVWDGVFTEAQATRGQALYTGACAFCHGRRLNGAPDDPDMRSTPPLARARFVRVWEGRSLATLFAYTRATMPEDNPGSLTDQENIDVIAYLLSVGGMPAGDDELQADPRRLARVVIGPRP